MILNNIYYYLIYYFLFVYLISALKHWLKKFKKKKIFVFIAFNVFKTYKVWRAMLGGTKIF